MSLRNTLYTSCIGSRGVETGNNTAIVGIYDFKSGDSNKIILNSATTSGNNYHLGFIYANAYPLINLSTLYRATSGFSGNQCYSYGENLTGDFQVVIEFGYNGCTRSTTGTDYVLLSSIQNPSGLSSGFFVGINESNRVYLKTDGVGRTINYELKQNNFLQVTVSQNKYIQFGVFDFANNQFINQTIIRDSELPNQVPLYLGGFLNNQDRSYTGFNGTISHSLLTNQTMETDDLLTCLDCFFVTGVVPTGTGIKTIQIPTITGYSTRNEVMTQTGYNFAISTIPSTSGTNISIYHLTPSTFQVYTNTFYDMQTGAAQTVLTGDTLYAYKYDLPYKNGFLVYSLEFQNSFMSGDFVEIYTYPTFNLNVNLDITGRNWPLVDGVQLVGNGLLETEDVDYIVNNNVISGYFDDDILVYDLISGIRFTTDYSGLWSRGKIQMSGGGFYPSAAQYTELGVSGAIVITGVSGQSLVQEYDLYMNGQKLISGVSYSRSGSAFILSGSGLPDFSADTLGSPVTGVVNIHDSELIFYPRENGPTQFLFIITGNGSGALVNGITGFSEQIWINGVRQTIDYQKDFPCSLVSGLLSYPDLQVNFYDNNPQFFNIGIE